MARVASGAAWEARRAWRRRLGWLFVGLAGLLGVWVLATARGADGLTDLVFLGLVELPVFILLAFVGIHFLIGREGMRRRR